MPWVINRKSFFIPLRKYKQTQTNTITHSRAIVLFCFNLATTIKVMFCSHHYLLCIAKFHKAFPRIPHHSSRCSLPFHSAASMEHSVVCVFHSAPVLSNWSCSPTSKWLIVLWESLVGHDSVICITFSAVCQKNISPFSLVVGYSAFSCRCDAIKKSLRSICRELLDRSAEKKMNCRKMEHRYWFH